MQTIARVRTDFSSKFGVPRQSGTEGLRGEVVFEPPFRNPDAVRGLEGFSHNLAPLAIFPRAARRLVGYGAPAAAGRQCARRRVRVSRALPAQSHRSFVRALGRH